MGFTGSDQSSYISLHAMAPYVVDELLAFKRLLEAKRNAEAPKTNEKKAPSWDRAEAEKSRREALNWVWHEVFVGASVNWGVAQKRTIGLAAFVKSCEVVGWDRDPSRLGKLLSSSENDTIALKDIEWLYKLPSKSEEQRLRERGKKKQLSPVSSTEELNAKTMAQYETDDLESDDRQISMFSQRRMVAASSVLTDDASVGSPVE